MENQQPLAPDTANLPKNGQGRPALLSSNATLVWRVFVPVFGTVFFTAFLLALWLTREDNLYLPIPTFWARAAALIVWLGWVLYVWRGLWPLKRIDADDAYIYVTNYWVTARYSWEDVVHLEEKRRLVGRRVVWVYLRAPGRFGGSIAFLPGSNYRAWLEEHGKRELIQPN